MGRAIGLAGAFFAGVRVAGELTWIPAHTKNGKAVNSRCIIPVYRNSHRGTNMRTGEKGRVDSFKLVAWGKLADTCCKSLPKGKALDLFSEPQSYEGTLYNMDGSPRLDAAGTVIKTTKVSFTILDLVFGEESVKQVQEEKQTGRRPWQWDVPNTPDYQLWTKILQDKQHIVWDGRSPKFGYARVIVPQGPGIQLTFAAPPAYTAPAAGTPAYVAPQTYSAPPAYSAPAAPAYSAPAYTAPAPAPSAPHAGQTQYVRDANGNFVPVAPTLPSMVHYAVHANGPAPAHESVPPHMVPTPAAPVMNGQQLF